MKLIFPLNPEGTLGEIFQGKKKGDENLLNTHESTQFFMLISNMLLIFTETAPFLSEIC